MLHVHLALRGTISEASTIPVACCLAGEHTKVPCRPCPMTKSEVLGKRCSQKSSLGHSKLPRVVTPHGRGLACSARSWASSGGCRVHLGRKHRFGKMGLEQRAPVQKPRPFPQHLEAPARVREEGCRGWAEAWGAQMSLLPDGGLALFPSKESGF